MRLRIFAFAGFDGSCASPSGVGCENRRLFDVGILEACVSEGARNQFVVFCGTFGLILGLIFDLYAPVSVC